MEPEQSPREPLSLPGNFSALVAEPMEALVALQRDVERVV